MTIRNLTATLITAGCALTAAADHTLTINKSKLSSNSGASYSDILIDGVSVGTAKTQTIPEGSSLTIVFCSGSGTVWGNAVHDYGVITEDLTIVRLPDDVISYRGTAADPILISSTADLLELKRQVEAGKSFINKFVKQTADIDCSDLEPWQKIGSPSYSFSATYNGCGHRIEHLKLASSQSAGLFGYFNGGKLYNLTVDFDGFAGSSTSGVGGALMSICTGNATVSNVVVTGKLKDVNSNSAGFAILAYQARFINCTNRMEISGSAPAIGGFAAVSDHSSSVANNGVTYTDCAFEGSISVSGSKGGTLGVSGFTGELTGTHTEKFTRATYAGSIVHDDAPNAQVAAFIGYIQCSGSAKAVATDCTATPGLKPVGSSSSDNFEASGFESETATVSEGTLSAASGSGEYEFTPAANQTSLTVSGFTGTSLSVPASIVRITGIDSSLLKITSGGYDITGAIAFTGNAEDGYELSLDPQGTVNGVKVTPTIGEDVDEPFSIGSGVSLVTRAIPGLWYELYRGTSPTAIDTLCQSIQATDDTVSLADELKPADGGFYRIRVSLTSSAK